MSFLILLGATCWTGAALASAAGDAVVDLAPGAGLVEVGVWGPRAPAVAADLRRELDPDRFHVVSLSRMADPRASLVQSVAAQGRCGILVETSTGTAIRLAALGVCDGSSPAAGSQPTAPSPEASPAVPLVAPEIEPAAVGADGAGTPSSAPDLPPDVGVVVHLLHVRTVGSGLAWPAGGSFDIAVSHRWSVVAGGQVILSRRVEVSLSVSGRYHPFRQDRGLFLDQGIQFDLGVGNGEDLGAWGAHFLGGRRWRVGEGFAPVVDVGAGAWASVGDRAGEGGWSLAPTVILDVGFGL